MSEPTAPPPPPSPAPETGVAEVDQAVAPLSQLDDTPLEEHPERLAAAHAALHAALNSDRP